MREQDVLPFCPGEEPYQSYVTSTFSKAFLSDRAVILASKYWENGSVPDTFKWLAELYSDIKMIDSFTGEPVPFITAATGKATDLIAAQSTSSTGTPQSQKPQSFSSRKKSNALLHDQYPLTSDIPQEWSKEEGAKEKSNFPKAMPDIKKEPSENIVPEDKATSERNLEESVILHLEESPKRKLDDESTMNIESKIKLEEAATILAELLPEPFNPIKAK